MIRYNLRPSFSQLKSRAKRTARAAQRQSQATTQPKNS